jgi:flagellar biosynthesis protein FlhF
MKVKKYIAQSMPEAMKVIRKEMGMDAVILQSKEIRPKGIFGRFRKKKIEVIAAKDPEPISENEKIKNGMEHKLPKPNKNVDLSSKDHPSDIVLEEIKSLKKIVELERSESKHDYPPNYQLLYHHLLEQDVEKGIAQKLIEETMHAINETIEELTMKEIKEMLLKRIEDKLNNVSFEGITGDKQIVQFVGPTGVGKTTTIAKVAAALILQERKEVAFITTDTYRIAAVEQLKTYARILNVPLEVAYHVDDYEKAIRKLSSYDIILVDTAGRNFKDPAYIQELKGLMGNTPNISTYLVLALTAKTRDLQAIFNQFDDIPLTQLIFTKLDETSSYGSLLSLSLRNNIGIAYVTNGQDVPDDLIKPQARQLSEWLMRDNNE